MSMLVTIHCGGLIRSVSQRCVAACLILSPAAGSVSGIATSSQMTARDTGYIQRTVMVYRARMTRVIPEAIVMTVLLLIARIRTAVLRKRTVATLLGRTVRSVPIAIPMLVHWRDRAARVACQAGYIARLGSAIQRQRQVAVRGLAHE